MVIVVHDVSLHVFFFPEIVTRGFAIFIERPSVPNNIVRENLLA